MTEMIKKRAALILFVTTFAWSAIYPIAFATTYNVSSDSELNNAIGSAVSGDIIKLAAGVYGSITIDGKRFTSFLTIVSSNKANRSKLGNIDIRDSSFIRLDSLEIEGSGSQVVHISDGSTDIEILNSDIHGELLDRNAPSSGAFSASFGVRALGGVARVRIENNTIHDVKNATAVFGGNDITLRENRCDWVQSDCYKFGGVDTLLFENNFGARNVYRLATSHVDFMQAQGFVRNGVFRGNVAIMGNESFQGLFFGGNDAVDAHLNNLIEDNIIYMINGNGITFNEFSSNNTVRYNTVLHSLRTPSNVNVGGDVKEFNVIASRKSRSRIENNNHYIQYEDATATLHYNDYYKDLVKDAELVMIEDFRPIVNSPADLRVGAFRRIKELLKVGTSFNSAPIFYLLLAD